jgi:hypothetical protein
MINKTTKSPSDKIDSYNKKYKAMWVKSYKYTARSRIILKIMWVEII